MEASNVPKSEKTNWYKLGNIITLKYLQNEALIKYNPMRDTNGIVQYKFFSS
jgi:hypothetical protein